MRFNIFCYFAQKETGINNRAAFSKASEPCFQKWFLALEETEICSKPVIGAGMAEML